MTLDFHLGPAGEGESYVFIGLGTHERLLRLAEKHDARLLLRVHDYYYDAHFEVTELRALSDEVTRLLDQCADDPRLQSFLTELIELTERALGSGRPIQVIAD